jgi:hypothetical protein
MTTRKLLSTLLGLSALFAAPLNAGGSSSGADHYTEPPLFSLRPSPAAESNFGCVGATGLMLRVYPGVVLKVEDMTPQSPAAGKFTKGEIISGINGVAIKGRNPYNLLGQALTSAEAGNGKMVFEVLSQEGAQPRKVMVDIPVLGAYSQTWPLKCKKSETIIKNAAAYYASHKVGGVEESLRLLFLLSTGDDQYLPLVKAHIDNFAKNPKGLGNCTWNNGYTGILCAEYFLRTGDATAQPILQYLCDNARDGQAYGVAWAHTSFTCNPGYVAGGILNAASAQVVTTLLMAKECGVKVDDKTLLGSLRFFYRFAGHGAVPYGDHRGEGLGSNGKDGMGAAMMHIASQNSGGSRIYELARNRFAMSMVDSYPDICCGHGDDGRGDIIWRSIAPTYILATQSNAYHTHMNGLRWWYDLSRRPDGSLALPSSQSFNDPASGAATALAYTAHLKTLRITGAPRSKHAKQYSLPAELWGRKAGLLFLSTAPPAGHETFGEPDPTHVTYFKFGNGGLGENVPGLDKIPRNDFLKALHHANYHTRAQAARGLNAIGAHDELEKLLSHKDPRMRRAALDGLTDYQYWFAMGPKQIAAEKVTPGMLAAVRKMLADPEESHFVIDGVLMLLSCAPPQEIAASLQLLMPWTSCDEWWIRQSAFVALADAAAEPSLAVQMLPHLREIYLREGGAQAREYLADKMRRLASKHQPDSEVGKTITAIFKEAVAEIPIEPGFRAGVGGQYIFSAIEDSLNYDPMTAFEIAKIVQDRLEEFRTDYLENIIKVMLECHKKLPESQQNELTEMLYGNYRRELLRRMEKGDLKLDLIVTLLHLKDKNAGWHDLGTPGSSERTWQFTSFEPKEQKDFLHPREERRFREVTVPSGLEKWYETDFDASKWTTGKAPIGKGVFKTRWADSAPFPNQSTWGDGEFLLARTTFQIDSKDYDFIRFSILANSGLCVYLNGSQIHYYGWWANPEYSAKILESDALKHLKIGTNVIAVYSNATYKDLKEGQPQIGQLDIRLEGIHKADLIAAEDKK